MIKATRVVNKSVFEKIDIDLVLEQLPSIEKEVAVIYCATNQRRKEDVWEKDGTTYFKIILDYVEVQNSKKEDVIRMMKELTMEKLKSHHLI